jgi:dTDP-4-amino-4,6-dideoxygalactose transaminase
MPRNPYKYARDVAFFTLTYQDRSWGRYDAGKIDRLQAALCAAFGCCFSTTCVSETVAVKMALCSPGIGPADEVILAAYE